MKAQRLLPKQKLTSCYQRTGLLKLIITQGTESCALFFPLFYFVLENSRPHLTGANKYPGLPCIMGPHKSEHKSGPWGQVQGYCSGWGWGGGRGGHSRSSNYLGPADPSRPESLLVHLGCSVPVGHSCSIISGTNLHPLDWFWDLQDDIAVRKTDWDCKEEEVPNASLCNTVVAIPSLLPHLTWAIASARLVGATLQRSHTLSQVLGRYYYNLYHGRMLSYR